MNTQLCALRLCPSPVRYPYPLALFGDNGRTSIRCTSMWAGEFTTNATASPTSLGSSIHVRFVPGGKRSVSTDPGITTETATPASRTSSISDSEKPKTKFFVPVYAVPPTKLFRPAMLPIVQT